MFCMGDVTSHNIIKVFHVTSCNQPEICAILSAQPEKRNIMIQLSHSPDLK